MTSQEENKVVQRKKNQLNNSSSNTPQKKKNNNKNNKNNNSNNNNNNGNPKKTTSTRNPNELNITFKTKDSVFVAFLAVLFLVLVCVVTGESKIHYLTGAVNGIVNSSNGLSSVTFDKNIVEQNSSVIFESPPERLPLTQHLDNNVDNNNDELSEEKERNEIKEERNIQNEEITTPWSSTSTSRGDSNSIVRYIDGKLAFLITSDSLRPLVNDKVISSRTSSQIWEYFIKQNYDEIQKLQLDNNNLNEYTGVNATEIITEEDTVLALGNSFSIFKLSTIFYFIGAILCVSAFTFFGVVGFLAFGGISIVFMGVVASYSIRYIARSLWESNNFLPSSLLYFVLVSTFPFIVYGILETIHLWPKRSIITYVATTGASIFVFMEIITIGSCLLLLKVIPFSFISTFFWLSFVYLLRDFPSMISRLITRKYRFTIPLFFHYIVFILVIYLYLHSYNQTLSPEDQLNQSYHLENFVYHSEIVNRIYSPIVNYFKHEELLNSTQTILNDLIGKELSYSQLYYQNQQQKLLGMITDFTHNFLWWGVIIVSYALTNCYINVYFRSRNRNIFYLRSYFFTLSLTILLLFNVNLLFRFILISITFYCILNNFAYLLKGIFKFSKHLSLCFSLLFFLILIHLLDYYSIIVIGKAKFDSAKTLLDFIYAFLDRTPYNLSISSICLNWFLLWIKLCFRKRYFHDKKDYYNIFFDISTAILIPISVFSFYPYYLFLAQWVLPQSIALFITSLLILFFEPKKWWGNYLIATPIQIAVFYAIYLLFKTNIYNINAYYYSGAISLFQIYFVGFSLLLRSKFPQNITFSLLFNALFLIVLSYHLQNIHLFNFIIPLIVLSFISLFLDRMFHRLIKYFFLGLFGLGFKFIVIPFQNIFFLNSFADLYKNFAEIFFNFISSNVNFYYYSPTSQIYQPISDDILISQFKIIFSIFGAIFLWIAIVFGKIDDWSPNMKSISPSLLITKISLIIFSFLFQDSILLFLSALGMVIFEIIEEESFNRIYLNSYIARYSYRVRKFLTANFVLIVGNTILVLGFCFPNYFDGCFLILAEILLFLLAVISNLKFANDVKEINLFELIFPFIYISFYAFFNAIFALGSLHYYLILFNFFLVSKRVSEQTIYPQLISLFLFTYYFTVLQYSLGYYFGIISLSIIFTEGRSSKMRLFISLFVILIGITAQSFYITVSGAIFFCIYSFIQISKVVSSAIILPMSLITLGLGLVFVGVKYDDISRRFMEGKADFEVGAFEYIPTVIRAFIQSVQVYAESLHAQTA